MRNQIRTFFDRFVKFKVFLGPKVWRYFVITVFFGIFWFFVDLSFIYVIQVFLISLGLFEQDKTLISNSFRFTPLHGVIFLCVFGFLRSLLLVARSFVTGMLAQEFALDHRGRILSAALIKENYQKSSAETLALFGDRIGSACNIVTNLGQLIITGIALCLYFGMGLYFSPIIFLIGVVLFIIILIPLKMVNTKIEFAGRGITESATSTYYILLLGMKNKFYLRLTDMIGSELTNGLQKLSKTYNFYLTYYKYSAIKNGAPMFIGTVVISFLTYIGVTFFQTPGIQLLSIFYVFLRLGQMAGDSNAFLSEIRFHYPSFMTLYHFFDENKTIQPSSPVEVKQQFLDITQIEMRNVSFSYNKERMIIDRLSFTIGKGQILLIKGPSGVGKSTVLALVSGLLKPLEGEVYVNGISLKDNKTNLPHMIGYVGPDPFIIPGTIKENLLYGNPIHSSSDEEIWMTLEQAECSDFILPLDGQLHHYLSELTPLSTGQKQRLALARALLRKPKLIIFDEATANLDSVTESKIKTLIKKNSLNSLGIIISHKDSFDEISDILLTLNNAQHILEFKAK